MNLCMKEDEINLEIRNIEKKRPRMYESKYKDSNEIIKIIPKKLQAGIEIIEKNFNSQFNKNSENFGENKLKIL